MGPTQVRDSPGRQNDSEVRISQCSDWLTRRQTNAESLELPWVAIEPAETSPFRVCRRTSLDLPTSRAHLDEAADIQEPSVQEDPSEEGSREGGRCTAAAFAERKGLESLQRDTWGIRA